MSKLFKAYLSAMLLAAAPVAGAADGYAPSPTMSQGGYQAPASPKTVSYGQAISEKLGAGLANIVSSPLEVPKTIINTSNQTNVALGITGGVLKGFMQMSFRIIAGVVDTVTFPWPTETLTTPKYVWDDYKVDTNWSVPLFKTRQVQ